MSKAAARNLDRKRELVEIACPVPGARAYRMGGCHVIVGIEAGLWHLTISRPNRLPSWEDVREARYALIPNEVTMAMLLPPKEEYVNVHEYCFGLWQIEDPRRP